MVETQHKKKILIIRFSSIGDIVLTSPIVRCLQKQLESEIHFITKAKFRSVIEHNPHIAKIYTFENEITEIISELRKEQYDLIIDLHKNLRSKRLIFTLGVKSLSFDKINVRKWLRVHTRWDVLPKKHLVDRYFEGISELGVTNDGLGLQYYPGLTEYDLSDIMPSERYMTIALGATYHTKRIPIEKIEVIIKASAIPCVLLGGEDVKELATRLSLAFPSVINYCATISLNQSAALILNSDYLATGDTGLMHMAAGLKAPMIVFWGSTAYELGMYPYYGSCYPIPQIHLVNDKISCSPCTKIGRDVCPKGHFKCMMDLDDAEIIAAVQKLEAKI